MLKIVLAHYDSPAHFANLQEGDYLLDLNNEAVIGAGRSFGEVSAAIPVGSRNAPVTVLRHGREVTLQLELDPNWRPN